MKKKLAPWGTVLSPFVAVLLISTNPVAGATFSAFADIDRTRRNGVDGFATFSCDGHVSGSSSAASECRVNGEVVSRGEVGNGVVRSFARAEFRTTDNSTLPGSIFGWNVVPGSLRSSFADTYFSDEINFVGLNSGIARLHIDLLGDISVDDTSNGFYAVGNGATSASMSFGITDGRSSSAPTLGLSSEQFITIDTDGEKITRETGSMDLLTYVDIAIVGGNARFSGGISSLATCWNPGINVGGPIITCSSTSDFSSSVRFTGATIFDSSGRDVTNSVSSISSSGFDYISGVSGHSRMTPVPVPTSLPLLACGLFVLGYLSRRKKCQKILAQFS